MAYTFLDNSLNTIGVLTNKGGQTNDYWGDSITHEIATSQDVLTSVSLSVDKPSVNIDTSGNQKTWNHVIQGLSFNIDGIGRKVNENDYLIYQEGTNGKYYLMAITQVDESAVQSGFHYKTVQGLNAAAYDLSRKTLRAKSFAQIPDNTQEKGTAQNILKYIFEDINWDVRTIGSFGAVDYDIAEGTTAQAVLLDIIGMFEAEVDAYVQLNNWGKGANVFNKNGSIKRIFDFSTSLGKYRGETIRYDKNMVSITKTGARDSMYTKLYVNGNNITIADANKGADFIVDDVANRKYNKLGAVSTPVTYLEGIISNSAIESPTALLAWGKKQLKILNHPRYNYQISATNDDKVQLGDTVIIQDTHASDPIYLKSKVISKTVSLADPVNNSFIVGEFSPIVIGADNGLEDTNQIMQLVNQANQTAINAQNKANENAKKIVDTRTNLEKTIDQKLQEGKDYSDSLDEKQKEAYDKFEAEINKGLEDAQKERDEISKKADDMLTTANSHADDMYNNAVAVAKDEASKALSDANTALYEAKTDLTDGLNKEIADRNKAVSAVNSQAQDYADQAKSDAIEAAKTADGQVRKDFKETTDALSSSISQNKEDSDGKISTAQSTATQALNGLSTKVSQTDYDKKTGDLSTKVNTVTQTANETKNELSNVSKTVDSQSAKINTISNTVDGTTQTISDIKTEQGKQSGSIATLQSRADGFDATVTKVNNLSVGGRNLLSHTNENAYVSLNIGNGTATQKFVPFINGYKSEFQWTNVSTNWSVWQQYGVVKDRLKPDTDYTISFMINAPKTFTPRVGLANGSSKNYIGELTKSDKPAIANKDTHMEVHFHSFKEDKFPQASDQTVYINGFMGIEGVFQIWDLKLEEGNIATTWSPAPEDLSGATAKAQLTADKATLDLSTYKTDADGRISKAQSDITATANEVKTKVSQSDFDTKTGDLTTKYGQVKATADAVTTDVAKYKKSNDGKVSANEAGIRTLSGQITSKVSQTDFDKKTSELNGKFTQQKQTVDSISQTVTELQAKANSQGQVNQLMNTEFNPDTEGWTLYADKGSNAPYKSYVAYGSNGIGFNTTNASANTFSRLSQTVKLPSTRLDTDVMSLSWRVNTRRMDNYCHIWLAWQDDKGNKVADYTMGNWNDSTLNKHNVLKWENISIPIEAKQVDIRFETREGTQAYIFQPMLVFEKVVGDYVQGNYNNNSRVSALEVGLKGITGLVNDPKKGLSATANLAANGLSVATKAQNDATTAIQTAEGVQTKVEKMGGINLLVNTEFNPDLEGWELTSDGGDTKLPYRSYLSKDINATTVGFDTMHSATSSWSNMSQRVQLSSTATSGTTISLSWSSWAREVANYNGLHILFYDNKDTQVGDEYREWTTRGGSGAENSYTVRKKWENITVPDTATYLILKFQAREGTGAYLAQPMLVFGPTIGDYVAGPYNNNNSLESTRTQLAGQITDEIKDRKSGDTNTLTQAKNFTSSSITKSETGLRTEIQQSASGVVAQVRHVNRLFNTQFTPDLQGWNVDSTDGKHNPYRSYVENKYGATYVGYNNTTVTTKSYSRMWQIVDMPGTINTWTKVSLSWVAHTNQKDHYTNLWLNFYDGKGTKISETTTDWGSKTLHATEELKWENIDVPEGTKTMRVSFEAREGTNAYLANPMLTFTPKAMPYMPGGYHSTSTVLELFDGRFALGIKNNTGNIISGINGDSSGLSIVGKKITISGDTTFLGKNFMDGALIKNASIGTAQIGKAAVGSAQIINVDVSKISGNIANFVTGNINRLNAHVLYGDTGHLGTTDTGRVINKQDNHLQLASKGMYNSANDRAQVELLSHTNDIDANMRGSFNYYSDVRKGHGLGIRLAQNQILAIDEDKGSKMLYLSPYQGGEVRVVSRDKKAYYPMRASSFNAMSSRSAKSNIKPFEDCALDIVKNTKVRTYVKSGKQEIGVISDEADPRMLTDDDNAVSLYDYTSILYKAVQELTEKVEELQNERPNDY